MLQKYYSNGKLLLSGEYFVLQGGKALAIPVNLGQTLVVSATDTGIIEWETYELNKLVFEAEFNLNNFSPLKSTNIAKSNYISKLLNAVKSLNSDKFQLNSGYLIKTYVEFNMQWGLGTSSTLINNLAQWCDINPFQLNNKISQGSGYDIACASAESPIIFQNINNKPTANKVKLNYPFLDQLSLVYLNRKMATEQNISNFNQNSHIKHIQIETINELTEKLSTCNQLESFMRIINKHENEVAKILNVELVKNRLFPDFQGSVKSLGAWGGDFVLAASFLSFEKQKEYFNKNGFLTVIPLKSLMIQ